MGSWLRGFLLGASILLLLRPTPLLGNTTEAHHTLAPKSQIQEAHRVVQSRQAAKVISRAMISFYEEFRRVTRRAKIRFEARDWERSSQDTRERLLLYNGAVWDAVKNIRELLGADATDPELWEDIKAQYEILIDGLYEADLGKTFYNRVGRRMFPNHVFRHRFTDDETTTYSLGQYEDLPIYKTYPVRQGTLQASITEILDDYPFQHDYVMKSDVAKWITKDINRHMREYWDREKIDSIEMVKTVFYRNKAAYLVGRILAGNLTLPIIIPLLNTGDGILVDTVVLDDMETSRIFSSTRTNFHLDVDRYREVVSFLETIFPNKNKIFLHKAVGYKALAKRLQLEEFFRELKKPHPLLQRYPELMELMDVISTEEGKLALRHHTGQAPYAKAMGNLRDILDSTENPSKVPTERPSLLALFQEANLTDTLREALTTYLGKKAYAEKKMRYMLIRQSLSSHTITNEEQEALREIFSMFFTEAGQQVFSQELEAHVLEQVHSLQPNLVSGMPIDASNFSALIQLIDVVRDGLGKNAMIHYLGSLEVAHELGRLREAYEDWATSKEMGDVAPLLRDLLTFAQTSEGKNALLRAFSEPASPLSDTPYEEIRRALIDPNTPLQKYPELLTLLDIFTTPPSPDNLADQANIKHLGWKQFGQRKSRYAQIRNELGQQDGKVTFTSGIPGTLLTVLTSNDLYGISSEIVLKVIKDDRVLSEQSTLRRRLLSAEKIRQTYHLVDTMDRVGRLLEPSTYENISFPITAFNPYVLKELLSECSERVLIEGDQLIIKHLYAMRKVTPLDVWLRENRDNPQGMRRTLKDLGRCIKDCAAQNLFLKDSTLRNFGVTPDGRVVIYDYDSLQLITRSEIREKEELDKDLRRLLDPDEDPDVRLEHYIFPSDLSNLLGNEIPKEYKPFFQRLHGEIFEEGYWRSIQKKLQAGEVLDFFPYDPERRFVKRYARLAAVVETIPTATDSWPVTNPSFERWEELEALQRETAAQWPERLTETLETPTASSL